jgi:septal ring factor EnvC (AmiA/AmiB activator)
MTQEEIIKDLEERIAISNRDHAELIKDLNHWKKVATGLKSYNNKLCKDLNRQKDLLREADELNEKRIALLEEKEKTIDGLQSQVYGLSTKNKMLEMSLKAKRDVIDECELTIYELRKPWWKNLFHIKRNNTNQ